MTGVETLGFSAMFCFHLEELGRPELVPARVVRAYRGEVIPSRLDSFRSLRHEAESNARRQTEHTRRQHERKTYSGYREVLKLQRGRKGHQREGQAPR